MVETFGEDPNTPEGEYGYETGDPVVHENPYNYTPPLGWDATVYGFPEGSVLVHWTNQYRQIYLQGQGFEQIDVFNESVEGFTGDDDIWYIYRKPLTADDPIPAQATHWWTPYTSTVKNWAVDIHSYDWGSLIPGLDFLSDTLDVAGKTVTLERKGRLLHANINTGMTSKDLYYQFPDIRALDSFLEKIGQEVGETYY